MEMLITGWLVLELTDSAWQVALVGFYRSIPMLVVGNFSGLIIDRFGRRNCILTAQLLNVAIHSIIALLLWAEQLAFWHIAVSALLMGTVWSVDWPARRSLIPDLLKKEQTVDAMILENVAQNLSGIIGPFIGGAFIAALGAPSAYTLLAGTAAVALLALQGISKQPIPRANMPNSDPPWARLTDGLRYGRQHQPILGVMLVTLAMNFLAFPYMTLLPVFARDVLHQDAFGLGLLSGANGVGAFIGLYLINHIRTRISNGWIFIAGSFFQCLVLVCFAASSIFTLSLLLLLIGGIGRACFGVMQSSIMLLSASDEMRSKSMGMLTFFIGMGPFGRLQIGGLAENYGAPFAVGIQSVLGAICLAVIAIALPQFRQQGRPVLNPRRAAAAD